ncbi:Phage integrase, N-terminal SAM-like domain [Roseovarius azorensis]|uniref:Phage integrase, N-terminal SAM-like domain n=1 Tax=Roseovarius azorensis TaxID=1287727 RepID=A0A1H7WVR6_9RHOB|nr:Phage integrase, N-terminal SAM-like domain [Roseovarius azorensis]
MPHLDHTAFVTACRDERGVGHHTRRAYAQDLRTFARYTNLHQINEPISRDDILGYPHQVFLLRVSSISPMEERIYSKSGASPKIIALVLW